MYEALVQARNDSDPNVRRGTVLLLLRNGMWIQSSAAAETYAPELDISARQRELLHLYDSDSEARELIEKSKTLMSLDGVLKRRTCLSEGHVWEGKNYRPKYDEYNQGLPDDYSECKRCGARKNRDGSIWRDGGKIVRGDYVERPSAK